MNESQAKSNGKLRPMEKAKAMGKTSLLFLIHSNKNMKQIRLPLHVFWIIFVANN